MRKILLDTNAYAQLLLGNEEVLNEIADTNKVYIPVIVLGELYAGFRGGVKEKGNKAVLEKFLRKSQVEIIYVNHETAKIFGELKHKLSRAGTPLPLNDIWIAASAVETGSVIVTYDKHFLKIPGVRVWDIISI